MTTAMKTLLHPVTDLAAAKQVYGALLGLEPATDEPYYVGYQLPDLQVGLVPNGASQGMTGPEPHWHVGDIEAAIASLTTAGATLTQEPHDVGGGRLVAKLADPDGNVVGLIQSDW
jgi:predicted enzyme related to lactoylglutathione lyase